MGSTADTKKAALKLMAGEASKINHPNRHPANLVHKAAQKKKSPAHENPAATHQGNPVATRNDSHETNKTVVIIGMVELALLSLLALR